MEYLKINSLYKREPDGKRKLIIGDYACEEFDAVKRWTVTEKVDGCNIRISMGEKPTTDGKLVRRVEFDGRTNNAQLPTSLLSCLQEMFPIEKLEGVFAGARNVILYGEGYGPKIQSGGYYRSDPGFILFDIRIDGWWFKRDDVEDIARMLGIGHVPRIMLNSVGMYCSYTWKIADIVNYVESRPNSLIAQEEHVMEGIVARAEPVMCFRKGDPIMFKLKCKDFQK